MSSDGGGSFMPLCPRPPESAAELQGASKTNTGASGSAVGVLRDGTLLAATTQVEVLSRRTTIHRAEVMRDADSGHGATKASLLPQLALVID